MAAKPGKDEEKADRPAAADESGAPPATGEVGSSPAADEALAGPAARKADGSSGTAVDPRPGWLRLTMGVVPALGAVGAWLAGGLLGRSLGLVLGALALIEGVRELRRHEGRWWSLAREALPPAVLVAIATVMLWPVPIGEMPVSQDHTVHLTRVWHFVTQQLAEGRITGWSEFWYGGWPAGEDYPPGGDMWLAAFYLGTFGLAGWEGSYALAFFAMWALGIWAMYRVGRVYLGPVAGTVAGFLLLMDKGGFREGGWNFTVYWGVWPMFLSTAFILLTLVLLDRVQSRGRPGDFVACGLSAGFAMLCHPFALLAFAVGLPIYVVARALGTKEAAGRIVVRAAGAFALGGGIAAYWLLPYMAKSEWMGKYGEVWLELDAIGTRLWEGGLFIDVPSLWLWLGALGGAAAVYRRHWAGAFFAIFAGVSLFLASEAFVTELDLIAVSSAFSQVQYQRFAVPVKLCAMLLAGFALQELFRRSSAGAPRPFRWSGYAWTVLGLLVLSPFVEPVVRHWGERYAAGGQLQTERDVRLDDYREFLAWSAREQEETDAFYRIAYVADYNDHFFAAAPVWNETPAYKVGYTPASTYKYRYEVGDPALYRLLAVKYVVSRSPQGRPHLREHRRFGRIRVYEFLEYTPRRYALEGPGRVEVERFDPQDGDMRLRLSGTTEESRLILHVSNYANWKAAIDGEEVPIRTATVDGFEGFVEVPARNGTLEVTYTWPWSNRFGALLALLSLLVAAAVGVRRVRPQWLAPLTSRLAPFAHRLERYGVAVGIALVLLPVLGIGVKAIAAPPHEGSFVDRLPSAHVEVQDVSGSRPCSARAPGVFGCSTHDWNYVGRVYQRVDGELRRCIWAHPVDGGSIHVTFPQVELGSVLEGHHGVADSIVRRGARSGSLRMEVDVGSELSRTFEIPFAEDWPAWKLDTSALAGERRDVHFWIDTTRHGPWHYCFDAYARP